MTMSRKKRSLPSRVFASVLRSGRDFFYPVHCPLCGKSAGTNADYTSDNPAFCGSCREALRPEPGDSCARCGAPVGPHLNNDNGCIRCRDDQFAFEHVTRLGVYDGPMRWACLRMKEPNGHALAAACAGLLWSESAAALRRENVDFVVPVPRHWTRRLRHRHDAAETIAALLARCLHAPFGRHILGKVRRTPPQTALLPVQRRKNLRNAFHMSRVRRLEGRTALLVDDVLTTGATAHEAARAMRKSGVSRVVVAVLARGLGR